MSAVKAAVFGRFRPRLLSLEKQLPYVFVHRAEEPLQGKRTGWVEFPHILSPLLVGENPAKSITWITLARLVFLSIIPLTRFCSIITSSDDAQSRPLLIHDASRIGGPDLNSGVVAHGAAWGSVM